ncbi:uncharacterized protein LOC135499823 [Lineus longissimus]|uniref:uncharacterized protein LOC135499823 n=1 Tax=Lineus longissimus TaxID=88925 RepID=UPI002B4CEE98
MVCTKSRKKKKSLAKHPSESCQQSSSFLFLSKQNVIRHVNRSKTMFIMRGLPGSGKSTLVRKIQTKYKGAVVCSADDYFSKEGEYEFNQDELPNAHQDCKEKVKEACEAAVPLVVVDNTNIRRWEMNPYFGIAHHQNYDVILVEPDTPWKFDPVELAKRNSHGVTEEVVRQKLSHFETVFPLYYGWFLNEVDSERLFKLGQDVFQRCMNLPEFSRIFMKEAGVDQENPTFDNFFKRKHFKTSIETLHCTTMFSLRGKKAETLDYIAKEAVEKAMGQVFMLSVIGFSISPRAFGARLRLNNTQLKLWFRDDNEERPAKSPKSAPSPERVKDSAGEGVKDRRSSKKSSRKKKGKKSDLSSNEFSKGGASSERNSQPDTSSVSGQDDVKHLAVQPDTGIQFFPACSESGVRSWSSVVSSSKTRAEAGPSKPNGGGSSSGVPGPENSGARTAGASKASSAVVTSHCIEPDQQPEHQGDETHDKNFLTILDYESDEDDVTLFGAFDFGEHSSDEDLDNKNNESERLKTADNICNNVTPAVVDSGPNSGANNFVSSSRDVVSVEVPIEPSCGKRTSGSIVPIVLDIPADENTSGSKGGDNKKDTDRPSCLPSGKHGSKVELFRTVGQEEESDDSSKCNKTVSKGVELPDKMSAFLEVCENHDEKNHLGSGVEICRGCDEVFENVDVVYKGGSMVGDGKGEVMGEEKSGVGLVGEGANNVMQEGKRLGVGEKNAESPQTGRRHRKTSRDKVDIGLSRQKRPSLELAEADLEPLTSPGTEPEIGSEAEAVFNPVEKSCRVPDVGGPGEAEETLGDEKKMEKDPVVDTTTYVPVATDRKEDEIVVKKTLIFEKKPAIVQGEQMTSSETDIITGPKVATLGFKTESEGSRSKKKKKKKKKKNGEELESSVAMVGEVGCGENGEQDRPVEEKVESSPEPADDPVKNGGEGTAKKKENKRNKKKASMEGLKLNTEKMENEEKLECDHDQVAKKSVDLAGGGKDDGVVKKKTKASVGDEPCSLKDKKSDTNRPGGRRKKNIQRESSVIDDEISAILFEIENVGADLEKKGQKNKKGGRRAMSKISAGSTPSRKSKGVQEMGTKKKTCIEKSSVLTNDGDDGQIQRNVCKFDSEICRPNEVEESGIRERPVSGKEYVGKSDTVIVDREKTSELYAQETNLTVQTKEASTVSHQYQEGVSNDGWQVVTKGGSHKSVPVAIETSSYLPNASDGPPKPKLKFENQTSDVEGAEGATAIDFDLDSSEEVDQSQKFRPTSGFGSRAHITIGCAENLSPVEAGYDLFDMIKFEAKDGSDKSTLLIDGATVKHYGGGHFGVYLDKVVRFEALFGGYY